MVPDYDKESMKGFSMVSIMSWPHSGQSSARMPSSSSSTSRGFPILGFVPYWGPSYKGSYYLGVLSRGYLIGVLLSRDPSIWGFLFGGT